MHSLSKATTLATLNSMRSPMPLPNPELVCGQQTHADNNSPLPPVAIVDYVYNPGGRDSDDMNGEWVAIANTGSQQVDMSGWILRDESTQNRFHFPAGFELASATEVVVHVGCGDDSQTDLYWCAEDPIWSNGGDTAILQLPSGTVVSRDRFDGDF